MKILYGKTLTAEENFVVNTIARECDIMFDTARLLFYRKIDTVEKAKRFLYPDKKWFNNPLNLFGMKEAVERIELAKLRKENVLVFGDYDADGVCATTVLYYSLKEYGIESLRIYVPEREDGYGLNIETISKLNAEKPIDLLITVDCGISDFDKIEILKSKGIEVIVTDHHEPPEILPDCIKINPKMQNQEYSFDGLCGAGVAYKLGVALIGEKADKYLDYVALATVADSMDLINENRDIVACGLKLLNNPRTLRLSFQYLLGENNKTVTAQTLAYVVAPRINAGGRMGDANTALKLFTETDPTEIFNLAVKLNEYNIARQVECDNIYREAKEKIKKYSLNKKDVILVKDEKWSAGFIGIVAAKLVEDYARPVIVFAGQDGYLKGSARSVDGVNIHDAITATKDLLLGFGGHSQAAGVSVEKDKFKQFDNAINEYVRKGYGKIDKTPKIYVEWDISEPITLRFAKEIDLLEPFGVGNKRPMFTTSVCAVDSIPLRLGSAHYTYKTEVLDVLDFNGEKNVLTLSLPVDKKVVFEINLSTFKGRESIKGYSRAVCPDYGDFSQLSLHILENELKKACIKNDKSSVEQVDELPISSGIGTVYLVSDAKNLKKYPSINNLPKYIFYADGKSTNDCIIVSPKEIPEGYDSVVYLDKPLGYLSTNAKCVQVGNICGYGFINVLSVERSDFANIFTKLITLKNKTYKGSADFARKYADDANLELFVFAIETFIELGIFELKNGLFTYNEKIKNALTNSTLYSKITLLKG